MEREIRRPIGKDFFRESLAQIIFLRINFCHPLSKRRFHKQSIVHPGHFEAIGLAVIFQVGIIFQGHGFSLGQWAMLAIKQSIIGGVGIYAS